MNENIISIYCPDPKDKRRWLKHLYALPRGTKACDLLIAMMDVYEEKNKKQKET